jgi:hypothetical protein
MTVNDALLISVANGGAVNGADSQFVEIARLLRLIIERYSQT